MPAEGPSLGIAPAGTWMWMSRSKSFSSIRQERRVTAREGPRGARGLLHDVAELSGQDELALAAHQRGLDEHDVAAGRRVVHARRNADLVLAGHLLGVDVGAAEERPDVFGTDLGRLDLAGGDAARDLARELAELALELAHARLARVAGNDLADRVVREPELTRGEAVLLDLPRQQVDLRDLELLGLGVAGERHDLHAVEERARDVLDEVRRRDEEDLREVERHAEVVVGEGIVLRRVEDLEQRRRRIALVGDPELVDLVEEKDGILGARLLHALKDPPRHGADVGPAVSADVGLVARAAERDADVLASHRARDRLGDRGLPDSRRSGKEEDAPFAVALGFALLLLRRLGCRRRSGGRGLRDLAGFLGFETRRLLGFLGFFRLFFRQLAHREELENPVLDVLQAVVVLGEDACGFRNVELPLARGVPRKLGDRLEVRPNDLRLHGLAADPGEPLPLPVDFLAGVLGQVERVELRPQLLEAFVGGPVAFAELLLDRLHLLAQIHFALAGADLFLDLGLDVFLRGEDVDLALHVDEDAAQAILDRQRLEKNLLGRDGNVEVSRDEVRESSGLVDLGEDLVHGLFGQSESLPELRGALARFPVEAGEGRVLRVEREHLVRLLDGGFEVALLVRGETERDAAGLALEHESDAAEAPLDGRNRRDRSDRVELGRLDVLGLGALGNGEDAVVRRRQGRLDGSQGS